MKVLITGSTGFLGSHLVDYLIGKGIQVGVLIRSTNDTNDIKKCLIHTWESDISLTSSQIRASNYDYIVHAATKYSFIDDPSLFPEMIDVSITLSLALNHACLGTKTKLITIGSLFESSTEGGPVNVYALLKKLQHEILGFSNVETHKILVGDMYGPRDKRNKLVAQLINATISGQIINLKNPSGRVYPVHVRDVLEGIYRVIISEENSSIQEIMGPDGFLSVLELKELVVEIFEDLQKLGSRISPHDLGTQSTQTTLRAGITELIEEAL